MGKGDVRYLYYLDELWKKILPLILIHESWGHEAKWNKPDKRTDNTCYLLDAEL